jgi:hypothetical protein
VVTAVTGRLRSGRLIDRCIPHDRKDHPMNRPTDLLEFADLGIDRRTINGALTGARNATMLALIGNPRGSYDQTCRQPTNPAVADLMETADFGPFRATGLRPAVRTLKAIMADIRTEHRAIHDLLGTAGMLCCRRVRGSATAISNHSWGTAIDLTIDGKLDPRGDEKTQRGLLQIHPIFNRHGFFWGAAFRTEDAMHFEASEQLVRTWAGSGDLGPAGVARGIPAGLTTGDRGPRVEALQAALNRELAPLAIDVDGVFGTDTRAAVAEFQRRRGQSVSGIATRTVLHALGVA